MPRPEPPDHGVTFDLVRIAGEMRQEQAYALEGHTARTLVRTPDLRVVLIAMNAGSRIAEHRVDETASIQTVVGHIRLRLPERPTGLLAGELLVLARGIPHSIEALAESIVVLTFGWRGDT